MNKKVLLCFVPMVALFLLAILAGCDITQYPPPPPLDEPSAFWLEVDVEHPDRGTVIIRVPNEMMAQTDGSGAFKEIYPRGTEVELEPFPAFGYSFDRCEDSNRRAVPLTFALSGPKYVRFYFKEAPYSLRVILSPPEGGIVEVKTGAGKVEPRPEPEMDPGDPAAWEVRQSYEWVLQESETVTLTAVPFEGYRFVAWASDDVTIENPHNPIISFPLEKPTTVRAYFALVLPGESEEDLDVDDEMTEADIGRPTVMTADIKPVVEIIDDKSGCRGLLRVNYEVTHLPEIPYLIDYVRLTIDGQEYGIWTGIPTEHYQDSTLKEVLCTGSHSIRLEATSTVPEERGLKQITVTEDVELPPVSAQFTWDLQDIPGEDCRKWLVVTFEAHDFSGPDKRLDIVSLKANTAYWYWKEGWNQEHHPRYTVRKEVFCGQIYLLELVATDVDGNKYTYLREVTIPTPQPPDEPAEPDEPPAPPPPQQTLYAAFMAQVQSIVNQEGCSSTLTVSFDGKDLTGGQYPIKSVKLKVTGPGFTETYDSKPVQNPNHHDTKSWSGLACGQTFNIEVTVTNSIGQTVTSTGSITTPIP